MPRPYNHVVKTEFDTVLNKAIGKKIKEARLNHVIFVKTYDTETKNIWSTPKKKPLTQTKLANALTPPKTFQQIQKYEKGTNGVSTIILIQMSKFFNKPLDYFTSDATELLGKVKLPDDNSVIVSESLKNV
jgi:hypothetical protein